MFSNSKPNKTIFIFGLGYVGFSLGKLLIKNGWKVYSTKTNVKHLKDTKISNIKIFEFNNSKKIPDLKLILNNCTHLLSTIGPISGYDPVLKFHRNEIKTFNGWIGYISSTSVYSSSGSNWIDEETLPKPISNQGINRLKIENEWKNISSLEIFRLSGIYGPNRNYIADLLKGNFEVIDKNDHLFNRIHRDDISNIIMKAMEKPSKNRILNLADGNPSSKLEVVKYTAKLIGAKPPIPIPFSKNKLSQSQRPYYLSSKKIHSNIKKILGIDLIFPSYREGIKSIVNDQS